uniref:Uncharacterized protein n=1 Tax=Ovis aries TaxID=9940 RepID=A0AC11EA12_SHEEP
MYPSNKKKKVWREEKERLLKMTIEERRKEYIRDYVPLNTIPSWKEEMKGKSQNDEENTQEPSQGKKSLSEKVSLYRGDITLLEVDAIVNAVVMYRCESWTMKKAERRRIDAFELWCWRRLLRVPWNARSNQSILKEISPGCSLEGLMLKLKL